MGVLKLLSAQASKTLYFYIAPPLKAALVHFVLQFFIGDLKGSWLGGVVGDGDRSSRDEPLAFCTNLGFWFDASGWSGLSSACHAQWKKSEPPRQDERISVAWTGSCGAHHKPSAHYLIWLDARGSMLWGSWELNVLLLGVNWFSVPVTNPNRTWRTRKGADNVWGFSCAVNRKSLVLVIDHYFVSNHPFGECSFECVNASKLLFSLPTGCNLRVTCLLLLWGLGKTLILIYNWRGHILVAWVVRFYLILFQSLNSAICVLPAPNTTSWLPPGALSAGAGLVCNLSVVLHSHWSVLYLQKFAAPSD